MIKAAGPRRESLVEGKRQQEEESEQQAGMDWWQHHQQLLATKSQEPAAFNQKELFDLLDRVAIELCLEAGECRCVEEIENALHAGVSELEESLRLSEFLKWYENLDVLCSEWCDPEACEVASEAATRVAEALKHGDGLKPRQQNVKYAEQTSRSEKQKEPKNDHEIVLCNEQQCEDDWKRAELKTLTDQRYEAMRTPSIRSLDAQPQIVLHLCSGRRRTGDVECHVEWQSESEKHNIWLLSVDVAVSAEHGNVLDTKIVSFWRGKVGSGLVIGALQGPPCESWTAVRFLELLDRKTSPPPLRNSNQPWGITGLAPKHLEQVHFGSRLLFVGLDIFLDLYRAGGFALIEHPKPAAWEPRAASIFNTAAIQWIRALDPEAKAIRQFSFNQGLHGAKGLKPTMLLTLRMPTLRQHLSMRQTPKELDEYQSMQVLKGVDDSGKFVTSAAKEYPSSMCCAIAKSIHDTVRASFSLENVAESVAATVAASERESFYAMCSQLRLQFDPYSMAGEIGADNNIASRNADA